MLQSCRMFGRRCLPLCRSYGRLRPVGLVFVSGEECVSLMNVNNPSLHNLYIYIRICI